MGSYENWKNYMFRSRTKGGQMTKTNYSNEIVYGRDKEKLFVRSLMYPEYIVYADTLREAFDKYLELYN